MTQYVAGEGPAPDPTPPSSPPALFRNIAVRGLDGTWRGTFGPFTVEQYAAWHRIPIARAQAEVDDGIARGFVSVTS